MNQDMKPSDAELQTAKELLLPALRQYRHNSDLTHGFVSGLEYDEAVRIVAELQRRQNPASVPAELAKHQPCGCVICTCENEIQCQGCGAKNCGTHPVGQFPAAAYGREQAQQWVPVGNGYPPENKICAVLMDDGSAFTAWASYWRGSRTDFAGWTFPVDPPDGGAVAKWFLLPEPPTC